MHMRLAPAALAGRLAAGLVACGCAAIGCSQPAPGVTVTWKIEPMPPIASAATVVHVTLQRDDGTPVRGATLRLQAHMTHPGMAPVTADVIEHVNGVYRAPLRLPMAGDWVFVVTGELAGGGRITSEKDIAAVQPSS